MLNHQHNFNDIMIIVKRFYHCRGVIIVYQHNLFNVTIIINVIKVLITAEELRRNPQQWEMYRSRHHNFGHSSQSLSTAFFVPTHQHNISACMSFAGHNTPQSTFMSDQWSYLAGATFRGVGHLGRYQRITCTGLQIIIIIDQHFTDLLLNFSFARAEVDQIYHRWHWICN